MKYLIKILTKYIPRHYLHLVAHVVARVISLFYRGNKYEDPISGIKYRKLLPYGRLTSRANVLAPDSLSLERHRLVWLYLKEQTSFFSDRIKFLHLAPEYCFLKKFRSLNNIEYITADLNSPWADVKMDVHNIPFEDNTFDMIMGNHLLEHVEDDLQVMREFYRVMKPGGFGIFMVPMDMSRRETYEDPTIIDPREREKHFWQSDHLRLYGLDYPERLKSVGFEVREDRFCETMGTALVERYCLNNNEIIYFVSEKIDINILLISILVGYSQKAVQDVFAKCYLFHPVEQPIIV